MKHCKKFSKDIQLNIFIWVVEAKLLFLGIETVELKKKMAEELQRLANNSQHPKMNELPAHWEAGLQIHFGESPTSLLFPDTLHPNSCGV